MKVNNNLAYQNVVNYPNPNKAANALIPAKQQPKAPVSPPGGNVENRQPSPPPQRPADVMQQNNSVNPSQNAARNRLNIYA